MARSSRSSEAVTSTIDPRGQLIVRMIIPAQKKEIISLEATPKERDKDLKKQIQESVSENNRQVGQLFEEARRQIKQKEGEFSNIIFEIHAEGRAHHLFADIGQDPNVTLGIGAHKIKPRDTSFEKSLMNMVAQNIERIQCQFPPSVNVHLNKSSLSPIDTREIPGFLKSHDNIGFIPRGRTESDRFNQHQINVAEGALIEMLLENPDILSSVFMQKKGQKLDFNSEDEFKQLQGIASLLNSDLNQVIAQRERYYNSEAYSKDQEWKQNPPTPSPPVSVQVTPLPSIATTRTHSEVPSPYSLASGSSTPSFPDIPTSEFSNKQVAEVANVAAATKVLLKPTSTAKATMKMVEASGPHQNVAAEARSALQRKEEQMKQQQELERMLYAKKLAEQAKSPLVSSRRHVVSSNTSDKKHTPSPPSARGPRGRS